MKLSSYRRATDCRISKATQRFARGKPGMVVDKRDTKDENNVGLERSCGLQSTRVEAVVVHAVKHV